jgi:hypothetical protein
VSTDVLERRLENLSVDVPNAGRVSARALGAGPRRRGRRWPRVAASAAAAVVVMVLVSYFAPSASTVVARVPLAGDALGARDRVTLVGDSATSNGHTVTLVAAYADATRTELVFHISPAELLLLDVAMTDQFGRAYTFNSSVSNGTSGDSTVEFEPLGWPDPLTGARITIHISQLHSLSDPDGPPISGSWTLHATLGVDEGNSLALPAPATLGQARLTFTSVIYTPASIAVDLDISGVSLEDLNLRSSPDAENPKGSPVFTLDLLDSSGQSILASDSERQGWLSPVHVHMLGYRSADKTYRMVATYHGLMIERTISLS